MGDSSFIYLTFLSKLVSKYNNTSSDPQRYLPNFTTESYKHENYLNLGRIKSKGLDQSLDSYMALGYLVNLFFKF